MLEQVVLPVGGETVKDDVSHEYDDPAEGRGSGRLVVVVAGQQEHADTE